MAMERLDGQDWLCELSWVPAFGGRKKIKVRTFRLFEWRKGVEIVKMVLATWFFRVWLL